MDALVVSEDPSFIVEAQRLMRSRGARAVGSLGPADSSWLPDRIGIAIVDAPHSGSFFEGRPAPVDGGARGPVSAGTYAERLSDRHPEVLVVLCSATEGAAGCTGGVASVPNRSEALGLLSDVVQ